MTNNLGRFASVLGTALFSVVVFSTIQNSFAEDVECDFTEEAQFTNSKCFTLGEVEIQPEEEMPPLADVFNGKAPTLQEPSLGPVEVLNLLREVWKIIEKNEPVLIDGLPPFTAVLPNPQPAWNQMGNWQMPKFARYSISAKNLMGIRVALFDYAVQFSYGGNYLNKGKYLTNVMVLKKDIDVKPGFRMDVDAKVPLVLNFGTPENPVAGLQVVVGWKISSVMAKREGQQSFVFGGDGRFTEVSPDFFRSGFFTKIAKSGS